MNKKTICERIEEVGVVPAVRVSSSEDAHFAADCVTSSGIPVVEITMTVPEAVALISHLVKHHQDLIVGAGTVLDTETANRCLDAGASFLTAPNYKPKIVEFAAKAEIAVIPGVLTPTEVIDAWDSGADMVKVYPCGTVGGEKYIKALKTALPQIPMIASGGVTQQTATAYIMAGAAAIGVGSELIPPEAIQNRESGRIRELARRFVGFVKEARKHPIHKKQAASDGSTDFLKFHGPQSKS